MSARAKRTQTPLMYPRPRQRRRKTGCRSDGQTTGAHRRRHHRHMVKPVYLSLPPPFSTLSLNSFPNPLIPLSTPPSPIRRDATHLSLPRRYRFSRQLHPLPPPRRWCGGGRGDISPGGGEVRELARGVLSPGWRCPENLPLPGTA